MDIAREAYLTKMSAMGEDDFTRQVLKPLFYAMDYSKVEFHGGQNELGRDLIAYRKISPNRNWFITYIQTKRLGNSTVGKESKKFFEIVLQLQQAAKTGIIGDDGNSTLS